MHWLKHKLTDIDSYTSVYRLPSNDRFAILLQSKHQYYYDYLQQIQQEYPKHFDGNISFGIGNEVTEFTQLASSFFEANEAYENALLNNQREFISDYHSKDIKELLQLIPKEKLQPFVKHTLGPLSHPSTKKDSELKQTLQVYMDSQCDITKTAEKFISIVIQ